MFDIGWTELLLIGIVALIVVGPQDLPRMFAALGRFTAKAKAMGREFQRAMDDAAKESGMADTAKDLRSMTSKKGLGLDRLEDAARKFEKWDPSKSASKKAPAGSETAKLAEKRAADAETRKAAAAGAGAGSAADTAEAKPASPKKQGGPKKASAAKKPATPKKAPAKKTEASDE